MSDSEEDANLPPQNECFKRCGKFAELTGTDNALAMCYLQDRGWDLQRSVSDYFEDTEIGNVQTDSQPKYVAETDSSSLAPSTSVNYTEPHRIRLLSWNVDGLDHKNLESRMNAVCELIKKENAHVVFLQEIVPDTVVLLQKNCVDYKLLSGHQIGVCDYFCVILLKKDVLSACDNITVHPYPDTEMGRNLLEIKVSIKGVKFKFMTSHLESCKEHSAKRVQQLKIAFRKVTDTENDTTVVFGGDLNLRDPEIRKANGLPENTYDVWEMTGKRDEAKFTWDLQRNDNKEMSGKFKPRLRFDRLYVRDSTKKAVIPVYFELVGLKRLKSCQRFASDHWGLLTHFDIV